MVNEEMAETEVTEEDTEDLTSWRWKIRCCDPSWERPKEERTKEPTTNERICDLDL